MRPPAVDRKTFLFLIISLVILAFIFLFRGRLPAYLSGRLEAYSYLQDLRQRRALKQKIAGLEARLVKLELSLSSYRDLKRENRHLRKMLGLKKRSPLHLVAASVIGHNPSYWRRIIFLDKGSRAGIKKGDVVLDAQADLLGRICRLDERHSQAILIYDPDFKIKVGLGSIYALAKGSLWRGMSLKYIPYDAEVKRGDEAFLAEDRKRGIRIRVGRVSFVYKDENSLTQEVFLEPYASGQEKEVFIVK